MTSETVPLRIRDGALIVASAAVVRLVYLWLVRETPFFDYLHLDPLYYLNWGREIAAGNWLGSEVFEQSPLYPYGLGGFIALVGERLLLLRILQLAMGCVACLGIGVLGGLCLGRRAGLAAGLLAAVYGPFLFYEGQVMKSFLNYLLVTGALVALYRLRRPSAGTPSALVAGIFLGLLVLVRANALILIPVLTAWLIWDGRARGSRGWARATALCLGATLVILPVTLRNLAVSGDLVLVTSGGGEVFYIGNHESANGAYLPPPFVRPSPAYEHEDFRAEASRRAGRPLSRAEASRYWFRGGVAAIRADPGRWLRLELRKFALFWNARELPDNYSYDVFRRFIPLLRLLPGFGIVAALAVVGGIPYRDRWRDLLPLYVILGTYLAGVLLFFNFSRFRLPAVPVLLVLAGGTLALLVEHLRAGAFRNAGVLLLGTLLVGLPMQLDLTAAADAPGQEELLIGYAWLDAEKPERALESFQSARESIHRFREQRGGTAGLELGSACFGEGSSLRALARVEESIEPLDCAVRLSPDDPEPLEALASSLREAGRRGEAEQALRRLVVLRPGRFSAWFDLASLAFESGDAETALQRFEEGRERGDPLSSLDLADYHLGVALVHLQLLEDRETALPHLQEVLRLNPAHGQAQVIRGILAG